MSPHEDFSSIRGPAPAGAFWMEVTRSQQLPLPLERVWALVSDPARRGEWDPSASRDSAVGGPGQVPPGGEAKPEWRIVRVEEPRCIAWRSSASPEEATGPGGAVDQVLQVTLQTRGGGTHLTLHHASPGRGIGVRLSRLLLTRIMATRLRLMVRAISQSA